MSPSGRSGSKEEKMRWELLHFFREYMYLTLNCRQSLVELIPLRTNISGQPDIDGKFCCQNFSFQLNYCLFCVP